MNKKILILLLVGVVSQFGLSSAQYGYDSRYFKHGSRHNELNGGTCREFLSLNSLGRCCSNRDDDCYMIHFDTRCYCDVFCDRSKVPDHSDCCPDASETCNGLLPIDRYPTSKTSTQRSTTVYKPPPPPPSLDCIKNGNLYLNQETFMDNCNECRCLHGKIECKQDECLVNTNLIQDINNNPSSTWKATNYSMFWGKTLSHGYHHRLGTLLSNKQASKPIINDEPEEESYDFRNEPYVTRRDMIRDQGECGASWAFSALDTATDRVAKVFEGKRGNETMSVQMIISCAILPGNADGCSPATMDLGWKFIENSYKDLEGKTLGGIVNEKCYPLESHETGYAGECKLNTNSNSKPRCPSDDKPYNKPLLSIGAGYPVRVSTTNDIMEEIKESGPVQVAFKVYDDFFMYKSGIYSRHPNAQLLDSVNPYHSVKVLGWGTENGVDYWLAANSWGTQWGEDGYFRIKREDDSHTEFGRHVFAGIASRQINSKNRNNLGKRFRNVNIQRRE